MTKLARSKLTSMRLAQRARIVLLAAQGMKSQDIAQQLDVGRVQVSRWRERYAQSRLAGLERDLPRGAPPATVDVARLVALTTQSKPAAATHWSTRTMAAALGISAASVSRHWRANGLKPHIVRGFKVSRDPQFVEKLEDIVGLYLSPPEHVLVLCCDEK
ncbi:MAG: IS630 family transposase, partial [Rhodoferax sp.]